MPYWFLNKETNEPRIFGSLPVMCEECGVPKSTLEYHFSRIKRIEYENEKYRIVKLPLERGKRN